MSKPITGTHGDFLYKRYVDSVPSSTSFAATGSVSTTGDLEITGTTTSTHATRVIDSTASFITNGVQVGDTVGNDTDASSATVVTVDSETQLTTTALTGGGDNTFTSGDAYTVTLTQTKLIDSTATFLTDGVRVGDIATNVTDTGAAATVISVDSETQITTDIPAGGGVNQWVTADDYSIAPSSAVVRVIYSLHEQKMVRLITMFSNAATGSLVKVFHGNNASEEEFTARFTQNQLYQIDPDLSATGETIIVELASSGSASLTVSFEYR